MSAHDPRRLQTLGQIIDLFVEALGDPSCPLRRALVLTDLWAHPASSLNDVMDRLDLDKSTAFRDIDWLVDHGCVVKKPSPEDAREVSLHVVGHAKGHLEDALRLTGGQWQNMNTILNGLSALFPDKKPTLREVKILISLTTYGELDKTTLSKALYNGPATTDQRALQNLIDEGLVKHNG
jgi:DNA-binding MarR family transcriptional regulator